MKHRHALCPLLGLLLFSLIACSGPSLEPAQNVSTDPFPGAAPEDVGLTSEALEALATVVDGYVEQQRIVGAELLVIQSRHTVLHRAFGLLDQEGDVPMEPNTLFNLRSMTKPFTGTAIHLLIEDGQITLETRVAEVLEAFDRFPTQFITVEDLLTHRSGLPLSILTSVDDYESLEEIAYAAANAGPDFQPGSHFAYSDTGTDVLGALIETITGQRLDQFVTERILTPLGMTNTFYYIDATADDDRAARIAPLYVSQGSGWTRFWTPESPLYPFAWGSQTLYSTPLDYARFLAMWLDQGEWMGDPLLSHESIERMLTPVSAMSGMGTDAPFPTGFYALESAYGQMATLHVRSDSVGDTPVVVGHSGSDGTVGWAWPAQDLIILFFTQSRGSGAPIDFEAEIDRLLLHPEIESENAAARERFASVLGSYIPKTGPASDQATVVTVRNGNVALFVPGEMTYELLPTGGVPAWRFALYEDVGLSFHQTDNGSAEGFSIHQLGSTTEYIRGEPDPLLPLTLEDVSSFLGTYLDKEENRRLTVFLKEGELAIQQPESLVPLELHRPDEEGWWALRLNPQIRIRFVTEEDGRVTSFTVRSPEGEAVRQRLDGTEDAVSPDSSIADTITFAQGDVPWQARSHCPTAIHPIPRLC